MPDKAQLEKVLNPRVQEWHTMLAEAVKESRRRSWGDSPDWTCIACMASGAIAGTEFQD